MRPLHLSVVSKYAENLDYKGEGDASDGTHCPYHAAQLNQKIEGGA